MNNSENFNLNEEKLVWCNNSPSTIEQNDLLYSLCNVIEKKNDEQVLLTECENGDKGCTFVCDSKNLYEANRQQFPLDQDDIIKLKYINDPTVLHHLYERYKNEIFYTKMGPLLIYINANKNINDDNEKIIEKYKFNRNIEELDLNVYNVANIALNNLNNLKKSQSIIVTGESGSGRSEISKKIINFLSYTKNKEKSSANNKESNVSEILKLSNYIIEAFGNAKTEKNKNCSRFVKLYTIFMNDKEVSSYEIKKLLLDKERLINRGLNESSFNVFYYILNGSDEIFKRKYFLKNIEDYNILKNENERKKSDDELGFSQLLKSLQYIFEDEKEIGLIFSVLSALLLLGNIKVLKNSDKNILNPNFIIQIPINYEKEQTKLEHDFYNQSIDDNTKIFLVASKLLNINPEILLNYFTKNDICDDVIHSRAYNEAEIKKRIECFIKTCYEELFNWIILKINSKSNIKNIKKNDPCINILDVIYFENLKENSLNELLINTTNEAIRKIYVDFFFKKRLKIYKDEDIESNKLNYIDNENLFKLLVSREESLFSFLENACIEKTFEKNNLCSLIMKKFHNNEYIKTNPMKKNNSFVIVHSNEEINYITENFIDKNVDILTCNFIEMIKKSDSTYMQQLCSFYNYDKSGKIMKDNVRYNIYSQCNLSKKEYKSKDQMLVTLLRNNLVELIKIVELTFCHFILCINPYENKNKLNFDKKLVLNQLNKFHIFELSQLKNGYFPYIFCFREFLETFRYLCENNNKTIDENDMKKMINRESIENLLNSYNISPKDWCIGKNMIFLNDQSLKILMSYNLSKYKISETIDSKDSSSELSSEKKMALELEKVTEKKSYSKEIIRSNIKMEKQEQIIQSYNTKINIEYNDRDEKEKELLSVYSDIVDLKNEDTLNDDKFSLDEYNKYNTSYFNKNCKSKTKNVDFKSFNEKNNILLNMESRFIEKNESNKNSRNTYGIMNFINSVTMYTKKLNQIHQALKEFDPINDQLKKDSVFNLGMENFYNEKDIFDDIKSENQDKKNENINEGNIYEDVTNNSKINADKLNKDEISESEIKVDEINESKENKDEVNEDKIIEDTINENENNSTKLDDLTYQDENNTFVEKSKCSFGETVDEDNMDENFTLDKTINFNYSESINYPLCCQSNLICLMNNLVNNYNDPKEIVHENYSIEKKIDNVKENDSVNCISSLKFKNTNEKLELLDRLNDLYIYNSNEKQIVMNILKQIKNDIGKIHGNKWNIFLCSSDCYFISYTTKEDELILTKECNRLKDRIMYSQEFHPIKKVNQEVCEYGNTNVVEYLSLPENKKVHEIYVSNNVDEKYLKDHYKILCYRSRKVNKFDFLSARSFYRSIEYKILSTRNITYVNTDFSYMDDKMKYNFKQHVINEFINNPDISMEDLSYSLLNLATYFYHEKDGTWCVFISTEKSFAGIVNIVKNRYLRMTVQNKNKKYNVILFETPS
ncbi:myosin E, putative, putative [Plasmodium relictum]|uniref:Myosin E, putative, putative n=1 Tax=Plasmodium relictum TaxID=85471 RepID=A0A1J1H7V7_PLARL|nr:myosin E, putative, putative [Plasmodium relictum]CRH00995.1 myosin E, putative, putative [Plasmodium relictum]